MGDHIVQSDRPTAMHRSATVIKQLVLRMSFKVYDPIGFLLTVTIQPKILMKDLW